MPDPNQLPPLPIQGGTPSTPPSPNAPVSGVMNFVKALGGALGNIAENVSTGGAAGLQRDRDKMNQASESRNAELGIAEQEAGAGHTPDTAALIASGFDPNLAMMLKEHAENTAKQNAQYGAAIDTMPNLDDRTKALMKMSLNNPQSAELVKGVMGNMMRQYVADQGVKGREVTAKATTQAANTRAGAELGSAKMRLEGTRETNKTRLQVEREEGVWHKQIADINAKAKGGAGGALAKAQKAAMTAHKAIISKDSQGNTHPERLADYNTSVIQSMPFSDAMNSYGFTAKDDDGNEAPLDESGIAGAANAFFKDPKSAEIFLNTFKTDISKMSDPRAVASAVDAHLQEAVARGKIDPANRDSMMRQMLAAVQLSLQNQQQQANDSVSTGSAFVPPDEEKSEDQSSDENESDNSP